MSGIPVVISSYNRLNLLKQTIETLKANSDNEIQIYVVDDASEDEMIREYFKTEPGVMFHQFDKRENIATVKNKGIELATSFSSKEKYVCLADNDIYFMPHWDTKLIKVLEKFPDIGMVGGKRHPHHRFSETRILDDMTVMITENQPGYHLLLERETLDKVGIMTSSGNGFYGYEDTILCEGIRKLGKVTAAVDPPVVYHCGLCNLNGKASDYPEMMSLASNHPYIKFL